jgi:hypothetical protein
MINKKPAVASKPRVSKKVHRGPKYKICVSGAAATGHCPKEAFIWAEAIGREVAKRGCVLLTGATTGIPYFAAKGAKAEGGEVIGFSPAASRAAHVKTYRLPTDFHDMIFYTTTDYATRDLLLMRFSDGIVTICGRTGTLNEFTVGFDDETPMAVMEGSGGTADLIRDILEKVHQGSGNLFYESDPVKVVDELIRRIDEKEEKAGGKNLSL